jgi:hypothetical protein
MARTSFHGNVTWKLYWRRTGVNEAQPLLVGDSGARQNVISQEIQAVNRDPGTGLRQWPAIPRKGCWLGVRRSG